MTRTRYIRLGIASRQNIKAQNGAQPACVTEISDSSSILKPHHVTPYQVRKIKTMASTPGTAHTIVSVPPFKSSAKVFRQRTCMHISLVVSPNFPTASLGHTHKHSNRVRCPIQNLVERGILSNMLGTLAGQSLLTGLILKGCLSYILGAPSRFTAAWIWLPTSAGSRVPRIYSCHVGDRSATC